LLQLKVYYEDDDAMQLLVGAHNIMKKTRNTMLWGSSSPKRAANVQFLKYYFHILSPTIKIKSFYMFIENNIQNILSVKLK